MAPRWLILLLLLPPAAAYTLELVFTVSQGGAPSPAPQPPPQNATYVVVDPYNITAAAYVGGVVVPVESYYWDGEVLYTPWPLVEVVGGPVNISLEAPNATGPFGTSPIRAFYWAVEGSGEVLGPAAAHVCENLAVYRINQTHAMVYPAETNVSGGVLAVGGSADPAEACEAAGARYVVVAPDPRLYSTGRLPNATIVDCETLETRVLRVAAVAVDYDPSSTGCVGVPIGVEAVVGGRGWVALRIEP